MLLMWNYMIYEVSVFWYYWSSQHCIIFYYPRKYILSWDICIFIVSLTWAVVFAFEWYLSGASIWGLKHQFHLASFLGKISNQWQWLLYCWGLWELMCDRKISKMWSYAEYPLSAQILPVHLNCTFELFNVQLMFNVPVLTVGKIYYCLQWTIRCHYLSICWNEI